MSSIFLGFVPPPPDEERLESSRVIFGADLAAGFRLARALVYWLLEVIPWYVHNSPCAPGCHHFVRWNETRKEIMLVARIAESDAGT